MGWRLRATWLIFVERGRRYEAFRTLFLRTFRPKNPGTVPKVQSMCQTGAFSKTQMYGAATKARFSPKRHKMLTVNLARVEIGGLSHVLCELQHISQEHPISTDENW